MIPVSELMTGIRYALRDMQGTEYSAYEINEALNQAASLLFSILGEKFSRAALKRTIIKTDKCGSAELPKDFHSIYKLIDDVRERDFDTRKPCPVQYRITGQTLLADKGVYALEYYYIPLPVRDFNGGIDAPEAVRPYLERMAVCMLGNDYQAAEAVAQAACVSLAAGEVSHFNNSGPVQVFGGVL